MVDALYAFQRFVPVGYALWHATVEDTVACAFFWVGIRYL
jgi:hypothetical protein